MRYHQILPAETLLHGSSSPEISMRHHQKLALNASASPLRPLHAFGTVALDVSLASYKTLVVRHGGDAQGKDRGSFAYMTLRSEAE